MSGVNIFKNFIENACRTPKMKKVRRLERVQKYKSYRIIYCKKRGGIIKPKLQIFTFAVVLGTLVKGSTASGGGSVVFADTTDKKIPMRAIGVYFY
jgi:hypothetical protein